MTFCKVGSPEGASRGRTHFCGQQSRILRGLIALTHPSAPSQGSEDIWCNLAELALAR